MTERELLEMEFIGDAAWVEMNSMILNTKNYYDD